MKRSILLVLMLALACSLPTLALGTGFGLWEPLEVSEGSIPEVNYERTIKDEQGRIIRSQKGLGLSDRDVTLKWDTSYRYEDTPEGLLVEMEETQFEIDGSVSLYIKQRLQNGRTLQSQWFSPDRKLVFQSVFDPASGTTHNLRLRKNLDGQEGDITINEAELPEDGPALKEVLYHFKADGSFHQAEHYVKKFLSNAFSLEPYEGQPTEAVRQMAAAWFSD